MCSDCSSAANLGEKWPHMWVLHESATPANVHLMSMYMSKLHDLDYAKIQNCFANNSFVKLLYSVQTDPLTYMYSITCLPLAV